MKARRLTTVQCASPAAAAALVEWLGGYWASMDGATVRTDAPLAHVERAPSGLLAWEP